jgi:hypothetical protein
MIRVGRTRNLLRASSSLSEIWPRSAHHHLGQRHLSGRTKRPDKSPHSITCLRFRNSLQMRAASTREGCLSGPFPPPFAPAKVFSRSCGQSGQACLGQACLGHGAPAVAAGGPRPGGPSSAFGRLPFDWAGYRCWILAEMPSGTRPAIAPGMVHASFRRGARPGPPVASIGACAWRAAGRFPGPRAAGCRNAAGCRKRKPR